MGDAMKRKRSPLVPATERDDTRAAATLGDDGQRGFGTPDGDRRLPSASASPPAVLEGSASAARQTGVVEGVARSEVSVGEHQVADQPHEGHADGSSRVSDGLRLLARRIRSFPEGVFPPSPPPSLLSVLTDELLVTASDVVKSVAAEDKALSGNAGFRLLAWTVADARGATAVLDKPLALTVGRRLDSRALTVREELAQAAEQDQGCSINVSEQAAMAKAREE
eukprot:6692917-Prymnesium_polylepis.1